MPQARWKAGDMEGAGDLFIFCFFRGGERGHGGMRDGPGGGGGVANLYITVASPEQP